MIHWSGIPRVPLGAFPTPFQELLNAGSSLGGKKRLFIKRDDMTGIALGGNKVRKLEFVLAEALARGCDSVITTGGAQSNHAAITAACCNKLGLKPVLVLWRHGTTELKGNLLLNQLQGAEIRFVTSADMAGVYPVMDTVAEELRAAGRHPFIIPLGASTPSGTLGYVHGMEELYRQAEAQRIRIDHLVCCAGSGGTYAGAVLGTKLFSPHTKVTGIAISEDLSDRGSILTLVRETAKRLNLATGVREDDIHLFAYGGEGYAIPSRQGNNALRKMARWEGLFLDPVYTGKTFGGLLDLNQQGYFEEGSHIVFLNTGGLATLFAIPMKPQQG